MARGKPGRPKGRLNDSTYSRREVLRAFVDRQPETLARLEALVAGKPTGLDPMQELAALYELQRARIQIDHEVEQKIKKLIPTVTAEIKVAANILDRMSVHRSAERAAAISAFMDEALTQVEDSAVDVTPSEPKADPASEFTLKVVSS